MAIGLAVVTGASSGIGAAIALRIAASGRPVLAVARREDRLRALAAQARAVGHAPIHVLALDLTSADAPSRVAESAGEMGGASWLVNDAGFGAYGPFEQLDVEKLTSMVRLNCETVVALTHAFHPQLVRAVQRIGDAAMLVIASAASFQPTPFMTVYGATKAFVLSFAEGLSEEWRGTGVYAGAFCPGPVATEFGEVAGTKHRFRNIPAVLTADEAAREALRQIERHEVVRVPTVLYGLASSAVRLVPRFLVRRLSGAVQRERP